MEEGATQIEHQRRVSVGLVRLTRFYGRVARIYQLCLPLLIRVAGALCYLRYYG